MFVGVVGSVDFRNKNFVLDKLETFIDKKNDVIVSGRSPRRKKDNIDIWAEIWGNEKCKNKPIIHEPKSFTDEAFKARNKLIAEDSAVLLTFIKKGQYKSRAWNTIDHFTQKPNFTYAALYIYNQYREMWDFNELPNWLKKRLNIRTYDKKLKAVS